MLSFSWLNRQIFHSHLFGVSRLYSQEIWALSWFWQKATHLWTFWLGKEGLQLLSFPSWFSLSCRRFLSSYFHGVNVLCAPLFPIASQLAERKVAKAAKQNQGKVSSTGLRFSYQETSAQQGDFFDLISTFCRDWWAWSTRLGTNCNWSHHLRPRKNHCL